jgi:hypothetical protein
MVLAAHILCPKYSKDGSCCKGFDDLELKIARAAIDKKLDREL